MAELTFIIYHAAAASTPALENRPVTLRRDGDTGGREDAEIPQQNDRAPQAQPRAGRARAPVVHEVRASATHSLPTHQRSSNYPYRYYDNRYYSGHDDDYHNDGYEREVYQRSYVQGMPRTHYPGYGHCYLCGK